MENHQEVFFIYPQDEVTDPLTTVTIVTRAPRAKIREQVQATRDEEHPGSRVFASGESRIIPSRPQL